MCITGWQGSSGYWCEVLRHAPGYKLSLVIQVVSSEINAFGTYQDQLCSRNADRQFRVMQRQGFKMNIKLLTRMAPVYIIGLTLGGGLQLSVKKSQQ